MKCEGIGKIILRICIMLILSGGCSSHVWLDGVQRGNYFGGEPVRRIEVEARVGN